MRLGAVVFDWAGTTVDFGSRAPMGVFVEAFARFGIEVTVEEARGPMGLPKRDHVAALMASPRIAAAWRDRHGRTPTEGDVDDLYEVFLPLNAAVAADYADLIPGVAATVAALRARGLRIGSTTGYTRPIMEPILARAAAQGYRPDNLVCAGDLAEGRPSPLMMYRTFADLGVHPPARVLKVDDTVPGIAEGVAAGTWTVGVVVSGNGVGLSREEWERLPAEERRRRREAAAGPLLAAGADVLVDTVADLIPVVDEIDRRLAAGERPRARAGAA
jgi:phosphonoacetaldehyde hydrolase